MYDQSRMSNQLFTRKVGGKIKGLHFFGGNLLSKRRAFITERFDIFASKSVNFYRGG